MNMARRCSINVVVTGLATLILIIFAVLCRRIASIEAIDPAASNVGRLLGRWQLTALSERLQAFLDARLVQVLLVRLLCIEAKLSPFGQAGARVRIVIER